MSIHNNAYRLHLHQLYLKDTLHERPYMFSVTQMKEYYARLLYRGLAVELIFPPTIQASTYLHRLPQQNSRYNNRNRRYSVVFRICCATKTTAKGT